MINLTNPEIAKYSKRLTTLVEDKASGMLLDPRDFIVDEDGNHFEHTDASHAVFETSSGIYLKQFISLWPLFQMSAEFKKCLDALTLAMEEILEVKEFSHVIACTPTSKFLMENLHQVVEGYSNKLDIHYLGNHPFLNLETREILDFAGENVLIITDVVCTGSQVSNIAAIVKKTGGVPVGVLSVFMTGAFKDGLIDLEDPDKTNGNIQSAKKHSNEISQTSICDESFGVENTEEKDVNQSHMLRVYSLCKNVIDVVTTDKLAQNNAVIKINPETVYPEQKSILTDHSPTFDLSTMYGDFESAQCVTFGYFNIDDRRFTSAIRYQCLFDIHGDKIWQKIAPIFNSDVIGISTYDIEDLYFKDFIEQRRPKNTFLLIPKEVNLETNHSFFLLPHNKGFLKGKEVVLILGSISSTEKLRHLTTLVASYEVAKITVICTLNRMGSQTTQFITRIKNILSGSNGKQFTEFVFNSLYDMPDINSGDLTKMQQKLATLFNHYKNSTRVPVFRRWMKQDEKYYKTRDITSWKFNHSTPNILFEPEKVDGIVFNTLDGKLSYLCNQLVAKRDYRRFIDDLGEIPEKEVLFGIFGILISDLNYLKLTSSFTHFRNSLIKELEGRRKLRLASEDNLSLSELNELVESEIWLMFGLALISYLDQDNNNDDEIIKVLKSGFRESDLIAAPKNLMAYFCNERIFYSISLLIHFSYKNFNQSDNARLLKEHLNRESDRIINLVSRHETQINRQLSDAGIEERLPFDVIKRNFNFIKNETGEYRYRDYHNTLRFLQSKIIYTRSSHSEILTNLNNAVTVLKRRRTNYRKVAKGNRISYQIPISNSWSEYAGIDVATDEKIKSEHNNIKTAIEHALVSIGLLEEIAEAANELCTFAAISQTRRERFVREANDHGFSKDVAELGDIFQKIRNVGFYNTSDLDKINRLITMVEQDIWKDKEKSLRFLIQYYVVKLGDYVDIAVRESQKQIESLFGISDVWQTQLESLKQINSNLNDIYVLCDPFLLQETLKNVFSNIKHTMKVGDTDTPHCEIQLDTSNSDGDSKVRLKVVTFGGSKKEKQHKKFSTFSQHQLEIARYGGSLLTDVIQAVGDEGADRVEVNLKLLTRNPYSERG